MTNKEIEFSVSERLRIGTTLTFSGVSIRVIAVGKPMLTHSMCAGFGLKFGYSN